MDTEKSLIDFETIPLTTGAARMPHQAGGARQPNGPRSSSLRTPGG